MAQNKIKGDYFEPKGFIGFLFFFFVPYNYITKDI